MSTTLVPVRNVLVRSGSDYGEFFVSEREPVVEGDHTRYSATWCCYSSFGVFGHHWYSMGEPFALFVQDIDSGYLLGKIARKVTSTKLILEGVRSEILKSRKGRYISRDDAREAWDTVDALADQYEAETLAHMIYESPEVHKAIREWDITTQEVDPQAVLFAERLWPKFVAELAKDLTT